jgi:hypothetical protein
VGIIAYLIPKIKNLYPDCEGNGEYEEDILPDLAAALPTVDIDVLDELSPYLLDRLTVTALPGDGTAVVEVRDAVDEDGVTPVFILPVDALEVSPPLPTPLVWPVAPHVDVAMLDDWEPIDYRICIWCPPLT